MSSLPLIPATVIGSWAFPGWYAKFCEDAARQPELFGADDREEAVSDAVRLAVEDQLCAGADVITDGEMQRVDFNLGFYDYLTGIQALAPRRKWGPPAHDQRSKYLCVDKLTAPAGLGLTAEYRRLVHITRAALRAVPIKVAVPGPYTLAGCLTGGDVYPDRQAVAEALVEIVNRELKGLVGEGVRFLQLDEPSFACHPEQPEQFLDLVARTVAGVDAKISMHVCFGNYRGRPVGQRSYRAIFAHLARTPVQQLALEFANREMAEIDLIREVQPPMELALGLVDVKNTWIEPAEFIAERLRTALRYMEPERLSVTPDCGFSQTPRSIACRKLTNMVEGVRQVRKELEG
jgi:5-methyltetrahydropteroyltriglutamate--homocysteine methyltransferase